MSAVSRSTSLSLLLVVAYLVQGLAGLRMPVLDDLQTHDAYRLGSGAVLGLYLASQWLLAVSRSRKWRSTSRVLKWHKASGALAPLFLYLHSTEFGFGYLGVLSSVYLANVTTAAAGPELLPRRRAVTTIWVALHVGLSVATVMIAAVHAWHGLVFR